VLRDEYVYDRVSSCKWWWGGGLLSRILSIKKLVENIDALSSSQLTFSLKSSENLKLKSQCKICVVFRVFFSLDNRRFLRSASATNKKLTDDFNMTVSREQLLGFEARGVSTICKLFWLFRNKVVVVAFRIIIFLLTFFFVFCFSATETKWQRPDPVDRQLFFCPGGVYV
jgi:hypothetical protein